MRRLISLMSAQPEKAFAVFPLNTRDARETLILIPVKNAQNQAVIKAGVINTKAAAAMPLSASPHNISRIIQQLQHRAYGWGGVFLLNDCSQEMKSLFTPFGIWLPRNSGMQQKLNKTMDISDDTVEKRLDALKFEGHALMTLIYKKGHIMLYVGNMRINNQLEAISYQNVWTLSPASRDTRYVIGGSVFLPMLKVYPENHKVSSQVNGPTFKLVQLDAFEGEHISPEAFATTH